jgi:hypothetical protein
VKEGVVVAKAIEQLRGGLAVGHALLGRFGQGRGRWGHSDPSGAAALGGQAGEARLAEVVRQAGFRRFRRATDTPFNLVLEARP